MGKVFGVCGVWVVHLVLLVVQLSFSGWHVVGKIALGKGVNPIVFATYREVSAAILMFMSAALATSDPKFLTTIKKEDLIRYILCGIFSFTNVVGFIIALKFTSAAVAASMQPSIPVWGMLLSVVLGFEKLSVAKVVGIIFAVGGSVTVALADKSSGSGGDKPLLGAIILVCQCAAVGSLIVLNKPLVKKYSYAVVTFTYYSIGMVITIFVATYYLSTPKVFEVTTPAVWGALAYAAFFATLFTYSSLTWANKYLDPSTVSLYMTFQPIFTTVLSTIFLHTHIQLQEVLGGVAIVVGLAITLYARKQQELREQKLGQPADDEEDKLLEKSINSEAGLKK